MCSTWPVEVISPRESQTGQPPSSECRVRVTFPGPSTTTADIDYRLALGVIGSRIPGIVDAILEDQTGTLVPAGNVAALTQAIRNYAADPTLRSKHGKAGRAFAVESFQQERVWGELFDTYQTLAISSLPT